MSLKKNRIAFLRFPKTNRHVVARRGGDPTLLGARPRIEAGIVHFATVPAETKIVVALPIPDPRRPVAPRRDAISVRLSRERGADRRCAVVHVPDRSFVTHEKLVADEVDLAARLDIRRRDRIGSAGCGRDQRLRRNLLLARDGIDGAFFRVNAVDPTLLLVNLVVLFKGRLQLCVCLFLLFQPGQDQSVFAAFAFQVNRDAGQGQDIDEGL